MINTITHKTFNFGKVDYNGTGKKINLVEIELELRQRENGIELAISGSVWNNLHTDIIAGGQCLDSLEEFAKTWNMERKALFYKLYAWWKLYHLNTCHAGTQEQEELLRLAGIQGKNYEYTKARDYLQSIGMLSVRGNEYGRAWYSENIPAEILEEIKTLCND